jgi:hypothetical protein
MPYPNEKFAALSHEEANCGLAVDGPSGTGKCEVSLPKPDAGLSRRRYVMRPARMQAASDPPYPALSKVVLRLAVRLPYGLDKSTCRHQTASGPEQRPAVLWPDHFCISEHLPRRICRREVPHTLFLALARFDFERGIGRGGGLSQPGTTEAATKNDGAVSQHQRMAAGEERTSLAWTEMAACKSARAIRVSHPVDARRVRCISC